MDLRSGRRLLCRRRKGVSPGFARHFDRSLEAKRQKPAPCAESLTRNAKTKLDALTAIRDYVSKSIRQAGPSFTELPLSELSPADTTLADGYGHAADRAILLDAMLSAAGFKPEFVLASGLPPIAGITNVVLSFPLPNAFQSPLVRVTVDGQSYYLNDTDQYSRLGSTAHDGRLAIALDTQEYQTIHAVPQCEDKRETVYRMSLGDNGKTRVGISRNYYGSSYNRLNRFFSELPPEERRRYYQEIVSGVAQGARPIGDLETKFDCYPGIEKFTVEIDKYSVVDGKYLYFDLPFTPSLFPNGADRRTLPLFIAGQSENTIRTEIELPKDFHQNLIAPRSEDLRAPKGSGEALITAKDDSGKWVMTHHFETAPAILEPKDYPALLKLQASLGRRSLACVPIRRDRAGSKRRER